MTNDELKDVLERLAGIIKQALLLIQKNRTASDRPEAQGYAAMMADSMERLEDVEIILEGLR